MSATSNVVTEVTDRGSAIHGDAQMQRRRNGSAEDGRSAVMRSTVSIILAPGCRKMARSTARFPPASPRLRVVFDGIDDLGDIAQRARERLRVQRRSRADIRTLCKSWSVSGHGPSLFGVGEGAFCQVGVGRLKRFANRFQTDAVAIELIGIHLDADGRAGACPM